MFSVAMLNYSLLNFNYLLSKVISPKGSCKFAKWLTHCFCQSNNLSQDKQGDVNKTWNIQHIDMLELLKQWLKSEIKDNGG